MQSGCGSPHRLRSFSCQITLTAGVMAGWKPWWSDLLSVSLRSLAIVHNLMIAVLILMHLKFWLILHLFQTSVGFFLLLNTREDMLKNVGKQTVDGSHWLPFLFPHSMEVSGCHRKSYINVLSSFTHLHVISNMYDLLSFVEHKRRDFKECSCCSFPYNGSEWGFWLCFKMTKSTIKHQKILTCANFPCHLKSYDSFVSEIDWNVSCYLQRYIQNMYGLQKWLLGS